MTVMQKLQQIAAILTNNPQPQTTLPAPVSQQTIMTPARLRPISAPSNRPVPQPDIAQTPAQPIRGGAVVKLSQLLRIGSAIHPQCRDSFVEQVVCGHYAYSRRISYRTNSLAAVYVGAFGPDAIKEATFSYSMAVWRINQLVGYDITKMTVQGPTGHTNSVAEEMIRLTDEDYWTREGVAEWLESMGL